MLKKSKIILVLSLVLIVLGVGFYFVFALRKIVVGSGKVITEQRNVLNFNAVSLRGTGNLILKQGDQESLTLETEDNIAKEIITEVKDNILIIKYRPWLGWYTLRPTKDINFYLTVKNLNKIDLLGSGSIKAEKLKINDLAINIDGSGKVQMNLEAEKLVSTVSGSGDFDLSGKVKNQEISFTGSGNYESRNLESEKANIKISGSAKIVTNTKDELIIKINGSGTVSYLGTPKVNQTVSGSGTIERIEK